MFKINGKEILNVTINGKALPSQVTLNNILIWSKETPGEEWFILTEDGKILLTENNEEMEVEH